MGRRHLKTRLSPNERIVAWRLAEGRLVPIDELITALWARDPNGGPDNPADCIALSVMQIREFVAGSGVSIQNRHGCGYSVAASDQAAFRQILADEIAAAFVAPKSKREQRRQRMRVPVLPQEWVHWLEDKRVPE